jgi:LysM repeat protein
MKQRILYLLTILFLVVFRKASFCQDPEKKLTRDEYIRLYRDAALLDMRKTGVPACITLAQGILESENGNSRLARMANNHFGIKCHSDWTGKTFFMDDDKENECFRSYESVQDSYDDHSVFLKQRKRYGFLFELPQDDYKGWAYGLKQAGYATNPRYPELLIRIIEENRLHELDEKPWMPNPDKILTRNQTGISGTAVIQVSKNNVKYTFAGNNDTYMKIARRFDMGLWQIYKYNELEKNANIREGEIIYLQPKRRSAADEFHIVKAGETMYSISQKHAIKTKALYRKNRMENGTQPAAGQKLWLKKRKPKS